MFKISKVGILDIWGVLQRQVYCTRINNVNHDKQRLIEDWDRFDHRIIERAVYQWCIQLRACVRRNVDHVEYM